jgi:hypothetical protein
MDFIDVLNDLSDRAQQLPEAIETEEATKNALIMPFIQALGYDVFNLNEVVPEFTADVGIRRGEKVDYAILLDGSPIILIECKSANTNIDEAHFGQLYRYFNVTDARFAILTNGLVYRFYTDLDSPNRMDKRPFLEFDLRNVEERLVDELKKFTKSAFDVDEILSTASQLKYTNEIKRIIAKQLTDPDEDFVRFFASQVYSGPLRASVREEFTRITQRAFRQFINDRIKERLESALTADDSKPFEPEMVEEVEESKIVTTDEEHEAYLIVRAILREVVDVQRVAMRDTQSYCGILLDDNNRKPICRLHFNHSQKYLGLFDQDKNEERYPIDTIDEIYNYREYLQATVGYYDEAETLLE